MKKNILLIYILLLSVKGFSQITVTKQHIAGAGRKIVEATDQGDYYSFPATGANKTWDFTDLQADYLDSFRLGVAGWYPGHQHFPEANIGLRNYDDDSLITYYNYSDSDLTLCGDFIQNGTNW